MNESTLVSREEVSDLDWLARNVHVWPVHLDTLYVGAGIRFGEMGWCVANIDFRKSSKITKDQWLARRATLEKRPSEHKHSSRLSPESVDKIESVMKRKEAEFVPFVSVEDAATAKQPAPKGIGKPILGMVLADLTNRALEGKEKYGEPLLAHNGRNPLWDAYQEALDLAMYLRQAIEEQK